VDSGAQIRDLVFYNNRDVDFLADIERSYDSRQLVMELKNVAKVEREHVNQLHRYLGNEFGRFGVIVTRNQLPRAIRHNTIDLVRKAGGYCTDSGRRPCPDGGFV
jgi:hypothetical protein